MSAPPFSGSPFKPDATTPGRSGDAPVAASSSRITDTLYSWTTDTLPKDIRGQRVSIPASEVGASGSPVVVIGGSRTTREACELVAPTAADRELRLLQFTATVAALETPGGSLTRPQMFTFTLGYGVRQQGGTGPNADVPRILHPLTGLQWLSSPYSQRLVATDQPERPYMLPAGEQLLLQVVTAARDSTWPAVDYTPLLRMWVEVYAA